MRFFACLILFLAVACLSEQPAEKNDTSTSAKSAEEAEELTTLEKTEDLAEIAAPPPATTQLKSAAPVQSTRNVSKPVLPKDFVDITTLDPSIRLDIRYATDQNFTKSKIYDCPKCLLRPEAAEAIVTAQKVLKKKGLGLKMFDCYRPSPYQKRLWDKVPNPDYVTPPAKGSMHSRGAAVDLTIVDANGKELDMGTPYDFFGREAHTDNLSLPKKVLENRRLLRETLVAVGFKGIRTEWWHFSFQGKNWPLSDYVWPCDN